MRSSIKRLIPSLDFASPLYKWWVLGNIMVSTFMAVLDSTIVNTALPKMMTSFGVSTDIAQWILTGYMMMFAIMLPTSGWFADRFGYKRTYTVGLTLFTLFSFGCGVSWNIKSLIMMRIGQAIGGGLLQPVGMAIIMREFPVEKRGLAMGFWSIAAAASISLGPMFGGYLVDNYNWHIIFTINVPVGIVCLFLTWIIQREYRSSVRRPFDLPGFISLTVFLGFLLFALSSGNAEWNSGGWTSDLIMACFGISFIGLVSFLVAEFNSNTPLVNLRLLGRYNFGLNNLVMLCFGVGMFGSTFLMPLYLQTILGYSALQSGLVFLPIGMLQATCGPLSGYFSDKVNPKIPIITGIVLFTVSFFLNSRLTVFSPHSQIMVPMYLRGVAMGILFSPLSAMALADIKRHEMAQASGMMNVIRQVGGSFGVAILQTILTARIAFHTAVAGTSVTNDNVALQHILPGIRQFLMHTGAGAQNAVAGAQAALSGFIAQQIFVMGVSDDFVIAAICTSLCIIPVIFLRNPKKTRQ